MSALQTPIYLPLLPFRHQLDGGDGDEGGQEHAGDAPQLIPRIHGNQRAKRIQTHVLAQQLRLQGGAGQGHHQVKGGQTDRPGGIALQQAENRPGQQYRRSFCRKCRWCYGNTGAGCAYR